MNLLPRILILCVLFSFFPSPCHNWAHAKEKEKLTIFASLAPVAHVVQAIGGDQVKAQALIPVGRDPHSFSPTPRQFMALSRAALYFTVGMTFENELTSRLAANHNQLHIFDCSTGIAKQQMGPDHHHHHHGGEGDPHIWLGIEALARMATNIADRLSQEAPDHKQEFQNNLHKFLRRLTNLDSALKQRLTPFKGRSFLVFHPSFGYFADSFGLVQEAVEIEGKSPSPRQLTAIIRLAKAKDIRVIFVQPQFDKRAAQRIAQAIGAQVVIMDPLAPEVFKNLREMAEKIASALGT